MRRTVETLPLERVAELIDHVSEMAEDFSWNTTWIGYQFRPDIRERLERRIERLYALVARLKATKRRPLELRLGHFTFDQLHALEERVAQAHADAVNRWQLRDEARREAALPRCQRLRDLRAALWAALEFRREHDCGALEEATRLHTFEVELIVGKQRSVHRVREDSPVMAACRALRTVLAGEDALPCASEKGSDMFGAFEDFVCHGRRAGGKITARARVRRKASCAGSQPLVPLPPAGPRTGEAQLSLL